MPQNNAVVTVTGTQATVSPGDVVTHVFMLRDGNQTVLATQSFSSLPANLTFMNVPPGQGYTVRGISSNQNAVTLGDVTSLPFASDGVTVLVVGQISVNVVSV